MNDIIDLGLLAIQHIAVVARDRELDLMNRGFVRTILLNVQCHSRFAETDRVDRWCPRRSQALSTNPPVEFPKRLNPTGR